MPFGAKYLTTLLPDVASDDPNSIFRIVGDIHPCLPYFPPLVRRAPSSCRISGGAHANAEGPQHFHLGQHGVLQERIAHVQHVVEAQPDL